MNYKWQKKANVFDTVLNYGPKREGAIGLYLNGKGYIGFGNPDPSVLTGIHKDDRIADLMQYDPQKDEWKALWIGENGGTATSPCGRQYGFAFGLGEYIYVGGGFNIYTNLPSAWLTDFWRVNPNQELIVWERLQDLPNDFVGRNLCTGFSVNYKNHKRGYAGLGAVATPGVAPGYTSLKDVWEYNSNPFPGNWKRLPDYPDTRDAAVGFCLDDTPYIGSGGNAFERPANTFYTFDGINWIAKANIPARLFNPIGFSLEGKGYIGMGSSAPTNLYEYDKGSNIWQTVQPVNTIPMRAAAVGFGLSGHIYVGTGDTGGSNPTYYNDFWELITYEKKHHQNQDCEKLYQQIQLERRELNTAIRNWENAGKVGPNPADGNLANVLKIHEEEFLASGCLFYPEQRE